MFFVLKNKITSRGCDIKGVGFLSSLTYKDTFFHFTFLKNDYVNAHRMLYFARLRVFLVIILEVI